MQVLKHVVCKIFCGVDKNKTVYDLRGFNGVISKIALPRFLLHVKKRKQNLGKEQRDRTGSENIFGSIALSSGRCSSTPGRDVPRRVRDYVTT